MSRVKIVHTIHVTTVKKADENAKNVGTGRTEMLAAGFDTQEGSN